MSLFSRLFRSPAHLPTPQQDEDEAQRLAREGKDPGRVQAIPAEPLEIPQKPPLPGFRGTVKLELTMDATGTVKAVVGEGAPFEHVAVLERWAHDWRFQPARMDDRPHPCRMTFEVTW
jgi:hypothetical protein